MTDDIKDVADEVVETPSAGRDGADITVRFGPRSGVRVGDTIDLCVDMERLHLFDADGRAIRG
jgi:hypothetical protein